VWILFGLLSIRFYADKPVVGKVAGIEGSICGLLAIYIAFAEILNEIYGRVMLPIFPKEVKSEKKA
jgi:succinate-acetate transporter protein